MQYARQAKLGRLENYPNWNTGWVFLNGKAEMLSNNSSKVSYSPSCIF
jgi:hypothetical protein